MQHIERSQNFAINFSIGYITLSLFVKLRRDTEGKYTSQQSYIASSTSSWEFNYRLVASPWDWRGFYIAKPPFFAGTIYANFSLSPLTYRRFKEQFTLTYFTDVFFILSWWLLCSYLPVYVGILHLNINKYKYY